MPNHERKLYHPEESDNDLRREIQSTRMMVNGALVWKLRSGEGITLGYFLFLFSVLFASLLWISAQYKWRRHRFFQPLDSVKWWWRFPVLRIHRKVTLSGTDLSRDL